MAEISATAALSGRSARFLTVLRMRRLLLGFAPLFGLAWAARACAVFPDQAVLPPQAGASAGGGLSDGSGLAGGGVVSGEAGGGGLTSSAGGAGGTASGGAEVAGGGAGGAPDCSSPVLLVLQSIADAWLDAGQVGGSHGSDARLYVVAELDERRTLVAFTVPSAPTGSTLLSATLQLYLEVNADAALEQRTLVVHRLSREFDETRVSWNNYGTGNDKWTTAGGDFAGVGERHTLTAATQPGAVPLDVTALVREAGTAGPSNLSLLVREEAPAPNPPAELAFTSREGSSSRGPSLTIEYCPQ